ncbi:MAG: ABC transporter ATP-binding protein [Nitrospirales bacterium]|nr:ABC transporter ATP-binding protein/permease [Nitrospirales bacterium]
MKSLLRVLSYMAPYRGLVCVTFFFAGVTTALELLPPWLIKVVIDDVIPAKNMDGLSWVLVGLFLAYGLKNLCNSLRIRFNNTLEQRVVHRLRQQVFAALQRLSLTYYENRSTGEIMSRVVNDTEHVQRIFIDGLEGMLTASLTLVGITTILFMLNWKMAVLVLLPIPILIIGGVGFTRRVHRYYHNIRQQAAELNGYLQDSLSGIRETMGFNRQPYELTRFQDMSHHYSQANLKAMYLWSIYSPGMIFIGSLGTVLIVWYGAGEVVAGRLSTGELVMFLSYLVLFYTPVNQIHSVNHLLQHALAASERVFDILDAEPAVSDNGHLRPVQSRLSGKVEWKDMAFSYRPGRPVYQHLSLVVEPGEHVALVGPSGVGKSTLMKLLFRYYDVEEGAIELDGYDIRQLPLFYLREQIGFVQQEPFLFNGTVRANLAYGDLSASRDRIEAVARAAQAHEFIQALPDGYDTWIGERGVKLSVGQKQRIAIARVLLKDPPIVVMDEATSNIDTETEVDIRVAMDELMRGRTTFIVAHRLSTLQAVDRIVVLEYGQIVEEGDHATLLARGGLYAGLYEAQFHV